MDWATGFMTQAQESYCTTVSGYSAKKTDMRLCWEQMLCEQCTRKNKKYWNLRYTD